MSVDAAIVCKKILGAALEIQVPPKLVEVKIPPLPPASAATLLPSGETTIERQYIGAKLLDVQVAPELIE